VLTHKVAGVFCWGRGGRGRRNVRRMGRDGRAIGAPVAVSTVFKLVASVLFDKGCCLRLKTPSSPREP